MALTAFWHVVVKVLGTGTLHPVAFTVWLETLAVWSPAKAPSSSLPSKQNQKKNKGRQSGLAIVPSNERSNGEIPPGQQLRHTGIDRTYIFQYNVWLFVPIWQNLVCVGTFVQILSDAFDGGAQPLVVLLSLPLLLYHVPVRTHVLAPALSQTAFGLSLSLSLSSSQPVFVSSMTRQISTGHASSAMLVHGVEVSLVTSHLIHFA